MTDKHTPGKWNYMKDGQCFHDPQWDCTPSADVHAASSFSILDDNGDAICLVVEKGDQSYGGHMDANARLIAAAPDLLHALQKARNQVVAFALDTLDADNAVKQVEYIDKAISSATGDGT